MITQMNKAASKGALFQCLYELKGCLQMSENQNLLKTPAPRRHAFPHVDPPPPAPY